MADARASLAVTIVNANPHAYEALVVESPTPKLAHELLDSVAPDQLPGGAAALAALWLWHDGLEESHRISQSLDNPDGSYWHAIMHRREGDFSNSKYWLAQCRAHAAGAAMAKALLKLPGADSLVGRGWDPFAFVDLVEAVHDRPNDPRRETVVAIQRFEWRILFDHCEAATQR
jgi:hypothetical protein